MPTFCRHNRLIQNCPICSREQAVEMRPVVSSAAPKVSSSASGSSARPGRTEGGSRRMTSRPVAGGRGRHGRDGSGVTVRRLARGVEDGYGSRLVPGLRSSTDAARLAEEIAFATHRLEVLAAEPPGLYARVADAGVELEERTWLAFLVAYLCPLEAEEPFAEIERVHTDWASGELPDLTGVRTGPRSAHEPERGSATLRAYRSWAARAGSQTVAFTGEDAWTSERRFDRVYERLALPGMRRDARFELLVSLGQLGVYPLRCGSLHVGGSDEVTVAAKRALGIGDPMLLGRRSIELAAACEVPLEALDLGLYSWGVGSRAHVGLPLDSAPSEALVERCQAALGL